MKQFKYKLYPFFLLSLIKKLKRCFKNISKTNKMYKFFFVMLVHNYSTILGLSKKGTLFAFFFCNKKMKVVFRHTNLVVKDWKKASDFYSKVFGMSIVPPVRDLKGCWLDKGVGYKEATIKGCHMRLPGFDHLSDKDCPTLEIFEYNNITNSMNNKESNPPKHVYRPGFGHIAFHVDNVMLACEKVLKNGGSVLNENSNISSFSVNDKTTITFAYVRDIEGNIIELQNYKTIN
ncbi:hypothetical protein RFI_24244 [Reticulomyxa filosa]|uniref:VOC domain-containing protein n=1 Tax=Reticulomyxa filosa TaxID=46433 RepID=X6MGW1_RETFI|nr:hypothetical protein RFI_24244 [Reticulomyxa filosa]|eukprot:ETO13134.1 hypothetical protein RFI_24244 [Reticulomyxa filosa]